MPPPGDTSGSVTVLCIDDRADGLEIRRVFLEAFGYQAITATSGRAGLDIVARMPVDVVILDYHMPEMDGLEVARILRRDHPKVPIIVLTGFVSQVPAELPAIVDAFITKGNRPNELLETLARVVGRVPKRPPRPVPGLHTPDHEACKDRHRH